MRKIRILAIALLIFIAPLGSQAQASTVGDTPQAHVIDYAELLGGYQAEALEESIAKIIENYNFDVVIVTTNSIGGKSPQAYADDYFDNNGYGKGQNGEDGVLLLVDMGGGNWHISTSGYGITVFTDYGIQLIGGVVAPQIRANPYGAFSIFVGSVAQFLDEARDNRPIDIYTGGDSNGSYYFDSTNGKYYFEPAPVPNRWRNVPIVFPAGFVISALMMFVKAKGMNTARSKAHASDYVRQGSFSLDTRRDLYLHSTTWSTPRPQQSTSSRTGGSSGGGSSTHSSSSGRSHGGGGGKF
ncbi:MAG: TPM domain-containing protein [Eubacteriaceae bacterium]|nr:TPM domain-containing protein [Eubacteriaceae bacterium]